MSPLTENERGMFSEIMAQMRHYHDELRGAVSRVEDQLQAHVREEDEQYSDLRKDNAKIRDEVTNVREDVAVLKTRWGILASIAAVLGAAVMAGIQKVFF